MSLDQINNYGPGDNNFTSFQETLDATRRGLAEITLSEYDTDLAPVVKVGSVFENNSAFFQVTTSDITPTGYSGISNSTTFYLYFDESATAFIYSATAPTWNDARQGWYNGDDRALFSMYKDSGGTLYQDKCLIVNRNDYGHFGKIQGAGDDDLKLGSELKPHTSQTEGSWSFTANGQTQIIPNGVYQILHFRGGATRSLVQSFINGSWQTISDGTTGTNNDGAHGALVFSDGVNYRVQWGTSTSTAGTVYYRKA
jgi:hypothetical protein